MMNAKTLLKGRLFVIATLFAILITSCEKPEPEEPQLSNKVSMISVSFSLGDNPSIVKSSQGVAANGMYYISVFRGGLSAIKPRFVVSDGATVTIDGQPVVNGETVVDFTNPVTVRVTSESGLKNADYEILAREGDPDIDNKAYKFMAERRIPGVSISIMKGTDMVYAAGFGYANVTKKERVTPQSLFRLASCTKPFTSMCIMLLYERGLLNIEQPVFGPGGVLEKQFPNVPDSKQYVTVRHLLQHQSGLADPMFTSAASGKTVEELIKYVLEKDFSYSLGTGYHYNNMAFAILGYIIETLSGKEYEQFLKEDLFPLMEINDIHVGGGQDQRRANECIYYMQDGVNGYGNNMQQIKALGGLIASTEQLMKVSTYIDEEYEKVPDIFLPETEQLMWYTPAPNYNRYGLGFRINHSMFPGAHYHTGNLGGTSTMWVTNDKGVSGAFLANSRNYEKINGNSYDDDIYYLLDDFIEYFR